MGNNTGIRNSSVEYYPWALPLKHVVADGKNGRSPIAPTKQTGQRVAMRRCGGSECGEPVYLHGDHPSLPRSRRMLARFHARDRPGQH